MDRVALHPEGVDRNLEQDPRAEVRGDVALLPEGVDRTTTLDESPIAQTDRSPSTRRAWIEIQNLTDKSKMQHVALHPEGVDRN